jgi:replicative superfamily II helicase
MNTRNTRVVVLETGSGKTRIAAECILRTLDEGGGEGGSGACVFVAPTNPLVEQVLWANSQTASLFLFFCFKLLDQRLHLPHRRRTD